MCERSRDVLTGQKEWSRGQPKDPNPLCNRTALATSKHLMHQTAKEHAYPNTYLKSNNSQLKPREGNRWSDRQEPEVSDTVHPSIRAGHTHMLTLQQTAKTNRFRPHWHINSDYGVKRACGVPTTHFWGLCGLRAQINQRTIPHSFARYSTVCQFCAYEYRKTMFCFRVESVHWL